MKKIPTVFERDWDGDRSRVLDVVHPGCEWVLDGEGVATRKYDGTPCLVRTGYPWKRYVVRAPNPIPVAFIEETVDREAGTVVGWVPVTDAPEDRWYREAWENVHTLPDRPDVNVGVLADGTYELLGPKVQGNPERFETHILLRHDRAERIAVPNRTFRGMRIALAGLDIEGIVFHHPDGRMAKIKKRDFGLPRSPDGE